MRTYLGSTLLALLLVFTACTGGEEAGLDDPQLPQIDEPDPVALKDASAVAMGQVTSVRFTLERSGAPVFIDAAEALSLESLEGVFSAPASAEAKIEVLVNESLGTEIGAIAIGEEIWLSNPVTGRFETLPAGFDIDPSSFFDPKGAWQPLLENLANTEFIAIENRNGGTAYRIRALAPEADIASITAGLVRGEDVEVDFWIDPGTARVTAAEFTTVLAGASTDWKLDLSDYGKSFEIREPTG